jgi:hypothetical protein
MNCIYCVRKGHKARKAKAAGRLAMRVATTSVLSTPQLSGVLFPAEISLFVDLRRPSSRFVSRS